MKKALIFWLIGFLALSLSACAPDRPTEPVSSSAESEPVSASPETEASSEAEAPAQPSFRITEGGTAVYSGLTRLATVDNFPEFDNDDKSECHGMQGLTVLGDYAYMAKTNTAGDKARLYRTDLKSGETVRLTDAETGLDYFTGLHHANDLCSATVGGEDYLFVTTMQAGKRSLQSYRIDGASLALFGSYRVDQGLYGIDIYAQEDGLLHFIACRSAADEGRRTYRFFRFDLDASLPEGSADLIPLFTLNTAWWDGEAETDVASWYSEGIGFHDGRIYVPAADADRSFIAVIDLYEGGDFRSGLVQNAPDLFFSFREAPYTMLEAESVAFWNGRMLINTNNKTGSHRVDDGLYMVNDYTEDFAPALRVFHDSEDIAVIDNFPEFGNNDTAECHAMQGMAILGQYAYTAKTNTMNNKCRLYRTDLESGETLRLTDAETGLDYFTGLHHANDLCAFSFENTDYLLSTSFTRGEDGLLLFAIEETALRLIRRLPTDFDVFGIDVLKQEGAVITLIADRAPSVTARRIYAFYTGSFDVSDPESIPVFSEAFTLNTDVFDGEQLVNLAGHVPQGFSYYRGLLYVPMTSGDHSFLTVYPVWDGAQLKSGKVDASSALVFKIYDRDARYTTLEAESCGFYKGELYFNCNRKIGSNRLDDAVKRVPGYTVR